MMKVIGGLQGSPKRSDFVTQPQLLYKVYIGLLYTKKEKVKHHGDRSAASAEISWLIISTIIFGLVIKKKVELVASFLISNRVLF
jgi:hypothetical protein